MVCVCLALAEIFLLCLRAEVLANGMTEFLFRKRCGVWWQLSWAGDWAGDGKLGS